MPSPLGHALAGIAVAWAADLLPGAPRARTALASETWYRRIGGGLTVTCAALAAAPDLDLFVDRYHRSITHSVTAVAVVGIVAALMAATAAAKRQPAARIAAICATAYATHLGLDWMGVDRRFAPYGVQLLWPFSSTWFISGWDLFPGTERHDIFSAASIAINAVAAARELAVMLPIVLVLWLVRVKALAGFSPELARGDHPPQ